MQLKFVHDLTLRCFVYVFIGQVNDFIGVHAAVHLFFPHFGQVVFVLAGEHVAAGEALDGDDHSCFVCVLCSGMGGSNCCIMALFLNQFLKIRNPFYHFVGLFIFVSSAFFSS